PVSVVVEQQAGGRLENARNAVILPLEFVVAATHTGGNVVVDETADEQVEQAVVVVIEPDGAGGPVREDQPGLFGDVAEGAVSVVVIQSRAAVCRDEQIGAAVIVIVPHGNAHAEALTAGKSGFLGHIGESAVAVILV